MDLSNISQVGFSLNCFCSRILTTVKIFKAVIEICKRRRKEEENGHLSFRTRRSWFEHWLGDFSFPLSHFYIQLLCYKCWASLQHKSFIQEFKCRLRKALKTFNAINAVVIQTEKLKFHNIPQGQTATIYEDYGNNAINPKLPFTQNINKTSSTRTSTQCFVLTWWLAQRRPTIIQCNKE